MNNNTINDLSIKQLCYSLMYQYHFIFLTRLITFFPPFVSLQAQ